MTAEKSSVATDLGKLALRLIVGVGIMTHGYPKLFGIGEDGTRNIVSFTQGVSNLGLPYPTALAWAAALSEFAGGLLLALGLFTRVAGFFILCTMSVALYRHRADAFGRKELALMYWGPALFFLLSGPGRFSLDALVFRRR